MSRRTERFLEHHLSHEYDPAARREYYLRTRKLKGRKAGAGDDTKRMRSKGTASAPAPRQAVQVASSARQVAAQKAALEAKLTKLKAVLRDLLDEAEKGSGDTKRDKEASKASGGKKRAESSDLTESEKRKKAAEARKDYKKEKKPSEPETKSLEEKISDVRERIAAIRAKLKAAIERAQNTKAEAVVRSPSDKQQPMKRKE